MHFPGCRQPSADGPRQCFGLLDGGIRRLVLTVEQQADALVLTVADNDTDYDRSTEILIASGRAEASISVSQLAADSNIARLRVLKTFSGGTVMSKSGRYVGGIISELQPDESYCYYPVIIDLQTDEWTKTGPFPSALYMLLRPYAISDQGLFFCFNAQDGSSPGIDLQATSSCRNRSRASN